MTTKKLTNDEFLALNGRLTVDQAEKLLYNAILEVAHCYATSYSFLIEPGGYESSITTTGPKFGELCNRLNIRNEVIE